MCFVSTSDELRPTLSRDRKRKIPDRNLAVFDLAESFSIGKLKQFYNRAGGEDHEEIKNTCTHGAASRAVRVQLLYICIGRMSLIVKASAPATVQTWPQYNIVRCLLQLAHVIFSLLFF